MEENKDLKEKEQQIEISIENSDNAINWLEKFLKLLKEYGPFKIIASTFMIAFISVFFYVMFNPTTVFEVYDEWAKRKHDDLMSLRMDMAPKIQTAVDKLTFKVGATRTMVMELHNGSTGNGGLPFTKCTATYEGLNIYAAPLSQEFQDQNLSLIPFATHLFNVGYWCGNTEELLNIDRALYHKMKGLGTDHFAACLINGVEKPLAFMVICFEGPLSTEHDCKEIREHIRHVAMELAVYIEINNFTHLIDVE